MAVVGVEVVMSAAAMVLEIMMIMMNEMMLAS